MDSRLRAIAATCHQEAVQLTSELIRIPSISGDEKAIAEFTAAKMTELDFDEVTVDWAGNVIGRMAGRGGGKSLNFNCHLDTVGVSEDEAWPYPPFSGTVTDTAVFGRGASDTKGAFAAQILAAAALKREGLLPAGDLYVTGSVGEEDTGGGSNVLSDTDSPYFARRGMAVIGFAPTEIKYVHTCQDQVSRAMLAEGLLGNMALAVGLGNA